MGFDLDPFDDIFADGAAKNARAGGKFQPKSKFQPRKASSSSVPSSQSVQTAGIAENDFTETLRTDEPLKNKEDSFSGVHSSDEHRSSELINPSEDHVVCRENVGPDNSGDWHSSLENSKSVGENADIFIGLESLDDFLSQESQHGTFHVTDMRSPEDGLGVPVLSPVNNSADVSNTAHCHMSSELTSMQDPFTCMETAVSNSNGDIHVDNRSETKEADVFSSQDLVDVLSELTTTSGRRIGKFQPKPKIQNHKEKHTASFSNTDAVKSISCPQDTESVPYQYEHMDEGLIPAFSDYLPTEHTSELPMDRDPMNPMENSQSDAAIHGEEADPDMPEKVASQKAKSRRRKIPTVSDCSSKHQNASILGQQDETRRSLRQRRNQKKACQPVDEPEDEGLDDRENPAERPNGSVTNEEDNNDKEYHMESDSENKRARIKSKKPVAEKEKTVRKRKGGDEASNESAKKPSKRFPHATRRNRRQVDKVLLETPEHEIDFQKLRIRDLILFAEYKERNNKTATTSETPSMNQSAGASFTHYDEDEAFTSEQGGFSNDEHEHPTVQESSIYINYQTFMNKTPSTRWSKQDTELFYEAVQQFGTDLSMIRQLFPSRTRRQILLKYKKEQRQHPQRLGEALTNRSKDLSHFEQVIERLKQIAAEEKQKYNEDDSIGLTGEEEAAVEASHETNEEVAKPEQTEEGAAEDMEQQDVDEVHSPVKSDDDEDDFYRWSQYKSEL